MRKRWIFGFLTAAVITTTCLVFAVNSGPHIEEIALAVTSDVEKAWEPLDNPRVVALQPFDPEVRRMSYPPQYEGIPLLVGTLAQKPLAQASCSPLFVEERVTVTFDGEESGELVWEGWVSWPQTPYWLRDVVEHFKPLLNYNCFVLHCELYYIGSVALPDSFDSASDDLWLIKEQRHFMVRLTPCYESVKAAATYQLEDQYYVLGEAFEFHVAALKYAIGKGVNEEYLKKSTFVGVFEK